MSAMKSACSVEGCNDNAETGRFVDNRWMCEDCADAYAYDVAMTRLWVCDCGERMARHREQGDQDCPNCGAWYNTCGQRLRDDWWDLPEWKYDDYDG